MTILIKCQLWQLSLQQDANKVPSGWPTRMETAFYEFDRPLKARKGPFMTRRTRAELHSLWNIVPPIIPERGPRWGQ